LYRSLSCKLETITANHSKEWDPRGKLRGGGRKFIGKVMDLTGKTEGRQTAESEKKLRLH